jgi:hypothetical protein
MRLHPEVERLARFASDELAMAERTRTAKHMARCTDCRATLAWVSGVRETLREANGPHAPSGAWARIEARLAEGEVVLLPSLEPTTPTVVRSARFRVAAAALLLIFAGAVAALVPGSPLRRWLERPTTRDAAPLVEPTAPSDTAPPPASDEPVTTLIVPAENGTVGVDIETPAAGLEVRVRIIDANEMEIQAMGAAASARFRSGSGRLTIAQPGAGRIVVVVPRGVPHVTVRVDGTSYLVKDRDQLRVLAPLADTVGSEIVLRLRS